MAKDENNAKDMETNLYEEVRILRERIDKDCPDSSMGWRVMSLLESLKALENQERDLQQRRGSDCLKLQEEVDKLHKILHNDRDDGGCDSSDYSFDDSNDRLITAKKELGAKLRSIVSLKRQLDAVPSQAELIQYDLRFSELNAQIQKKHRQTRKHYDTYNALMEINELIQKEISLLNSISKQFQNAITSADGRVKLINSLEGILEGIQQKLVKAQTTWHSEQRLCDSLKEKYSAALSERRQSSLLKLFQEECARNERLKSQIT